MQTAAFGVSVLCLSSLMTGPEIFRARETKGKWVAMHGRKARPTSCFLTQVATYSCGLSF